MTMLNRPRVLVGLLAAEAQLGTLAAEAQLSTLAAEAQLGMTYPGCSLSKYWPGHRFELNEWKARAEQAERRLAAVLAQLRQPVTKSVPDKNEGDSGT